MLFFYFKLNRCGTCRGDYTENDKEPWIACDQCDQWYHGRCQGLTLRKINALKNKQYICSTCWGL